MLGVGPVVFSALGLTGRKTVWGSAKQLGTAALLLGSAEQLGTAALLLGAAEQLGTAALLLGISGCAVGTHPGGCSDSSLRDHSPLGTRIGSVQWPPTRW